jgi:hypothetical protein
MMHGDGGVKEGEIGARGEVSYSMQTWASINDGGRRRPTAALGPTPDF